MNENPLHHLLKNIRVTREDEIQCEEAETMMARCADACQVGVCLSDEESQRQYPSLWRHFGLCPDCAKEYRLLRTLVQLEADGQLEQPAEIPPLPDEGRPAIWAWAADAVSAIFPGFSPALAGALARDTDLQVEPVEVVLSKGQVRVLFDVAVNEQNADLRDLFCTVSTGDEVLRAAFEGSPVWLQAGNDGPAVAAKVLNELGGVAFSGLSPARYALRMHLAGQEYVVADIILP